MKKKVIVIISVLFLASLVGGTIAYYVGNGSSRLVINTLSKNSISINYNTNEMVNVSAGIPLSVDEIDEYAFINRFTIMPNEKMDLNARYQVVLKDIEIDNELKTSDFKWSLLKNNIVVSSSDFSEIGDKREMVLHDTETLDVLESYEFKLWLQDNGLDQSTLMSKGMSAKIDINVYIPS